MSRRTRATEALPVLPTTTYGQALPIIKAPRAPVDKRSTASHRLSMISNSSGGRRSSASLDGSSLATATRPSGIPRPRKTSSSTSRPEALPPSRPAIPQAYRPKVSPNLDGVANRTAIWNPSTERLAPTNITPRIVTDDDLVSLEPTLPSFDMDHDTVFGVALPQKQHAPNANLPPRLIPELQALAAATQRRPTPAMSTISTMSSPSTQFTTSSSPWSASTTATTPTSWSSASPALVQPVRAQSTSKRSQTVPIPAIVRNKMPKLPVLQESSANSATSSQINVANEDSCAPKKIKKKTPLNSPAPTPPPRSSSVKRNRSRSNSQSEGPQHGIPQIAPPLQRAQDISPITRHVEEVASRSKQSVSAQALSGHHQKLQEAISLMPSRPSRDGTENLDVRRPQRVNTNHTKYTDKARKLLDAAPIEALPQTSVSANSDAIEVSETEAPRSRLGKFSKLGLFGRSPKKSATEDEVPHHPRKLQRRGPTAGTGHEGCSRFGRRERRTSIEANQTGTESESSIASTTRKPLRSESRQERSVSSRRNRSSQSDLDDFASSRMKPVVLVGGSQKTVSGSTPYPALGATTLVPESNAGYKPDTEGEAHRPRIASTGPLMRESRLIFHLDSLDTYDHQQPQPASRRSRKFDKTENFRLPEPIKTTYPSQPYSSSRNTSQSSIAPMSAALTETSNDHRSAILDPIEKQRKKGRKLNWGIFKKKDPVPDVPHIRVPSRNAASKVAVQVATIPSSRQMPYYAMIESENEINSTAAIGEFLTEAARSIPALDGSDNDGTVSLLESEPAHQESSRSTLLPSRPHLRREKSGSQQKKETAMSSQGSPMAMQLTQTRNMSRPPRLAQVGRIPKVVPTTQASTVPQPSSSRILHDDFAEDHPDIDLSTLAASEAPVSVHTDPLPSQTFSKMRFGVSSNAHSTSAQSPAMTANLERGRELLKIPDRYSTTSSSSEGVISVMGPPLLPAPEFPRKSMRYTTSEDDVWNEYDDFIDRVISPPRLKKSTTRITDEHKAPLLSVCDHDTEFKRPAADRKMPQNLTVDTSLAPPPLLFASPISLADYGYDTDLQLRRSRIVSALHSSMDPSSPFSIGDYLAELGETKRNSGRASGRLSDSTVSQTGLGSPATVFAFPEPPKTQPEYRLYENAVHMDELERSKDPIRHSERSYASLMVSRWLSFGRVLFSPAHADLQKQPERHVLVIDGLGNEDWSIYCAVTYQAEQALVYDLKETGHTRSATSPTKDGRTPPNFRRREMASFHEAFKFPDNFFSVIVLRFPPVMAESKLKNIISECRRVLAPGGYMELMLLDLDIVNMGVVTRRAMRDLKTKITLGDREMSLKPVIDNVQSVLGEKGFSKLSRCVVGVPVVGKPPGGESPASSRSSGESDKFRRHLSAGPRPFNGSKGQQHFNFSLNDLVADHSDNADAKIGKAVSRTARSWWQHCFEAAVISDGNLARSIFADKQVLNECKSRASSFKLLIAHTQKPANHPVGTKRRTMSEPVIATLATSGMQ